MNGWRRLSGARLLFAPIALRLVDDFTGAAPLASLGAVLERQDAARWIAVDREAVRTMAGIIAYPGLGRTLYPLASPVEHYRVRLTDNDDRLYYRPAYRFTLDGLEFDVPPWNDTQPPASVLASPEVVFLWPAANYPFPRAVPVLHGRTIDAGGGPLVDARIATATDQVLSDERGTFSLPIRLTAPAPSIMVIAEHARSAVSVSVPVPLPAGLASALELQLM